MLRSVRAAGGFFNSRLLMQVSEAQWACRLQMLDVTQMCLDCTLFHGVTESPIFIRSRKSAVPKVWRFDEFVAAPMGRLRSVLHYTRTIE